MATNKPGRGSGTPVYVNIVDYMNEKTFQILSPQYWDNNVPEMIIDGEMMPLFEEPDRGNFGLSRKTIADMIDMRDNNVPFEFCDPEDVFAVKEHLDMYLSELSLHIGNSDADAYMKKAAGFQREVTVNCKKLLNSPRFKSKAERDRLSFANIIKNGIPVDEVAEKFYAVSVKSPAKDES